MYYVYIPTDSSNYAYHQKMVFDYKYMIVHLII